MLSQFRFSLALSKLILSMPKWGCPVTPRHSMPMVGFGASGFPFGLTAHAFSLSLMLHNLGLKLFNNFHFTLMVYKKIRLALGLMLQKKLKLKLKKTKVKKKLLLLLMPGWTVMLGLVLKLRGLRVRLLQLDGEPMFNTANLRTKIGTHSII